MRDATNYQRTNPASSPTFGAAATSQRSPSRAPTKAGARDDRCVAQRSDDRPAPYVVALADHFRRMRARAEQRQSGLARRMRWTSVISLVLLVLAANAHADRLRHEDEDEHEAGVELDVTVEPDATVGASPGALAGMRAAPPIGEVLEAAYAAAGLDRDSTKSWIRRARVAGLVPWVTVRTGWDESWRDAEPTDVGRGRTFEVRATWRLDRLLFDGRELQMSSIDAARRRERRRLASRVIHAYFTWRKVTALATRDARFALAAEAATAELDALTDGWFSDRAKSAR